MTTADEPRDCPHGSYCRKRFSVCTGCMGNRMTDLEIALGEAAQIIADRGLVPGIVARWRDLIAGERCHGNGRNP